MFQQFHHETIFALMAIVLTVAGAFVLAVTTDDIHGARQLRDEYAGFNELVYQLLGKACPVVQRPGK